MQHLRPSAFSFPRCLTTVNGVSVVHLLISLLSHLWHYAGPCSRALLAYLLDLHNPSKGRLARGTTTFDLHVMFVDEGAAWGLPPEESSVAVDAARASAEYGSEGHNVVFRSAALEDVFCGGPVPGAEAANGGSGGGSGSGCGGSNGSSADGGQRRKRLVELLEVSTSVRVLKCLP